MQRLAGPARRHVDFQILDVLDGADRLIGVHHAAIGAGEAERTDVAEFVLQIDRGEIGQRLGADQRTARRHERQIEHFDLGKAPGREHRRGPDDVGVAVARLIEQVRRRAAELHRGENVDADAVAGIRLHLARPGHDEFVVRARHRGHEMMQLEHHLRRVRAREPQHGRSRDMPLWPPPKRSKVRRAIRITVPRRPPCRLGFAVLRLSAAAPSARWRISCAATADRSSRCRCCRADHIDHDARRLRRRDIGLRLGRAPLIIAIRQIAERQAGEISERAGREHDPRIGDQQRDAEHHER